MSERDEFGNYVNEQGVTIKITDKGGKDHISLYDGPVDGDHSGVHINIDYKNGGSWNTQTHDEGHSNSERNSGDCFLTSACMKAQSDTFDDNCYELRTLRWFRDRHVSADDIAKYYQIAPAIVAVINKRNNSDEIYQDIYEKVVCACVNAIEAKNFMLAYRTYCDAVKKLETEYLA